MGGLDIVMGVHGEVYGHRLLYWLRSRAQMERDEAERYAGIGAERVAICHGSRADLLTEMADGLERELDTEGVDCG